MPNLTTTEMSAWRGFLAAHTAVTRSLDSQLAEAGLSLTEYSVLVHVQESGSDGVRMTELAGKLGLSGGGLTRLADRLEKQGYLERRRCAVDGRGFEALLTRQGKQRLKRVHTRHLRAVRERFLDRLSHSEIATLATMWPKLVTHHTSRAGDER